MWPLRLFGVPRWVHGDRVHALASTKPVALLAYLAQRGAWVARSEVALLFWPDADESHAHHALRQLVYRARHMDVAGGIEVEGAHLRTRVDCDVLAFRRHVASAEWHGAVRAYGGRFLDGLQVPDAPGFEAWLEVERAELQRSYLEASVRAATADASRLAFGDAAAVLETAIAHDPLAEEVAQALIRCLALDARQGAALSAAARFTTRLRAETGLEPSAATLDLIARVRAGVGVDARPHNLPGQASPFIGRDRELREIGRHLADPGCRLLTLVGPGGIGKTRLALQAAAHQIGAFRHGVFLVTVAALGRRDAVAAAIAETLGLTLADRCDPSAALVSALRPRESLLVLDNLEPSDGVGRWLVDLLGAAPGITLLVTSREPLDLAAAWTMTLDGLDLPAVGVDAADEAASADSVRLFVQAAERVRPGFSLGAADLADVARVCHRVAGVPLALELAAGWVQLLSPAEIAHEIDRDLDFLERLASDATAGHASLRALFDSSWARLDEAQRELAMRLSVFVRDVDLPTVEAVGGGRLSALMALVRRSFVRRNAVGRLEMHPLVLQYAREKLAERPELARDAELRHAHHVAATIAGAEIGTGDGAGYERPRRLLPDVERAWATLVERRDWTNLVVMLPRVFEVHDVGSTTLRYLSWVERALEAEPEDPAVRGRLHAHRAGCLQRVGRYLEMERDVDAALGLLPAEPPLFEHLVALRARGNAAYLRGDLRRAAAAFEAALAVSERLDQVRYLAGCLNNLGLVFKSSGDLDGALGYLRRARSLTARLDDAVHAQVLNNLATVQARRGANDDAEALLRESAELKRRLGDDRGLASVYSNLGNLRAGAGDHVAAERLHRDGLRLAEGIGDASGVARAHTNLGDLALRRGDVSAAVAAYGRSLEIKRDLDECAGVVEAYAQLATCHRRMGDEAAAGRTVREGLAYAQASAQPALVGRMLAAVAAVDAAAPLDAAAP
jgi:predicted ATPase/DNA-binding SARP family transcriptional activator/predicted negative regulator of RcsB-dependent stress response